MSEYLEVLQRKTNELVAKNIGEFLVNSRNVQKIEVFYRWNLIENDPDDNKFVDCAIAGNVKFIVSNDAHFKVLRGIAFPSVEVIHIDEFLEELNELN